MTIETDVVITGAGPCGLSQVYKRGLLDIHAPVIETLPQSGGQCAELNPSKPIYDVPAYPAIGVQGLTDRLRDQIAPFKPGFPFGQQVDAPERRSNGRAYQHTSLMHQRLGAHDPYQDEVEAA